MKPEDLMYRPLVWDGAAVARRAQSTRDRIRVIRSI